jgi:cyclophilin family peptidyl-prolyl cis-trans isomerase
MTRAHGTRALAACLLALSGCLAWTCPTTRTTCPTTTRSQNIHDGIHIIMAPTTTALALLRQEDQERTVRDAITSRRSWMFQSAAAIAATATATATLPVPLPLALADSPASTSTAQVTDRIFLEIKGLGEEPKKLVIGLYGKNAPRSTQMLKQLVNAKVGLPAPCRPKAERALQKEQLEANKVYNSCVEAQDKGVNYEYSQIWRIVPNERIDVGAVAGKFIAREYPTWDEDDNNGSTRLMHDAPGVVSVRRGDDSGFGFTIYPGGPGTDAARLLDEEHIVVGKVENLDLLQELNRVPVIVTSSKLNYMGLTGGPPTRAAPTRACQYGGPMYCNEYKPLVKLSILNSGSL